MYSLTWNLCRNPNKDGIVGESLGIFYVWYELRQIKDASGELMYSNLEVRDIQTGKLMDPSVSPFKEI